MDLILAFLITFILLILSVYHGIFVVYPLCIGLILFFLLALKRGHSAVSVLSMAYKGGKKSFIVLKIFILIGAITAIWMTSGTVPAIVYYGVKLLNPHIFILSAFLISCFVSLLIGTSFGTVGTVGIALMVIARGGGMNTAAAAGAVIAGAYFGDRCSPMSSSASLVASLTKTNIYDNIKNMMRTSLVPLVLSIIFYTLVSFKFPLHNAASSINQEIVKVFNVNAVVLLPALCIIGLSLFKINVKVSMLVSIFIAFLISVLVQRDTILNCLKYIFFGYSMDKSQPLYAIIKGGGVLSMLKTALVVFVSSSFSGIFEGTGMLMSIEQLIKRADNRYEIFRNLILTSLFTATIGCSQAIAIILTHLLNKDNYEKDREGHSLFAVDLENTAVVIAPLIPWNIALLLPMVSLGVNASCIPYLFYLYMLPASALSLLKLRVYYKRRVEVVK